MLSTMEERVSTAKQFLSTVEERRRTTEEMDSAEEEKHRRMSGVFIMRKVATTSRQLVGE